MREAENSNAPSDSEVTNLIQVNSDKGSDRRRLVVFVVISLAIGGLLLNIGLIVVFTYVFEVQDSIIIEETERTWQQAFIDRTTNRGLLGFGLGMMVWACIAKPNWTDKHTLLFVPLFAALHFLWFLPTLFFPISLLGFWGISSRRTRLLIRAGAKMK